MADRTGEPDRDNTGEDTDDGGTRWLDAEEKEAWTGLVSLVLLLPRKLEQPLHQGHGITLFEYLVLSHMSEAPQRRLRMGELAHLASGSLSRLSNVVKRLEDRGCVERSPDPSDGRYTTAALTEAGFAVVHAAAPTHLHAVRRLVLDVLDAEDQKALARIAGRLRDRADDGA